MKYVYHGTSVKNLKVIKPINKFVYATPVRELLLYLYHRLVLIYIIHYLVME